MLSSNSIYVHIHMYVCGYYVCTCSDAVVLSYCSEAVDDFHGVQRHLHVHQRLKVPASTIQYMHMCVREQYTNSEAWRKVFSPEPHLYTVSPHSLQAVSISSGRHRDSLRNQT